MTNVVSFRDFEERDIDFVYRCKNDEKLNDMIVHQSKSFSYEDAKKWVEGCMGEHDKYKFWAICTNDESRRIIGWISLSEIDRINNSACFHGIVIGDEDYRDGKAWIESYLFILKQVFEIYNLNRIWGKYIESHPASGFIAEAVLLKTEGIFRDAIFRNGKYLNIIQNSMLSHEYYDYLRSGELEYTKVFKRLTKIIRLSRTNKR